MLYTNVTYHEIKALFNFTDKSIQNLKELISRYNYSSTHPWRDDNYAPVLDRPAFVTALEANASPALEAQHCAPTPSRSIKLNPFTLSSASIIYEDSLSDKFRNPSARSPSRIGMMLEWDEFTPFEQPPTPNESLLNPVGGR